MQNLQPQNFKKKTGEKSLWLWVRQCFLRYGSQSTIPKRTTDKLDFIKIEIIQSFKKTIKRIRTSHHLGENVCKTYICQRTYAQNI